MEKSFQLQCDYCKAKFFRENRLKSLSLRNKHNFCCRECMLANKRTKIIVKCGCCQKSLFKTTREINESKSGHVFCNHSCCAKYNNIIRPQIKKFHACIKCNQPTNRNSKYCKLCSPTRKWMPDYTLKEVIYTKHHKSSAFALVRLRARIVAKKHHMTKCAHCGYNKHVEIAHIKPIPSFPPDTLLSVINDISNLKPLCPNCHWEFDHPSPS